MGKGQTRLFEIPFDATIESELDAAKNLSQHGEHVKGEFKNGNGTTNGIRHNPLGMQEELTTVIQPHPTLPPKN